MVVSKRLKKGSVSVSPSAIAAIAGNAATECYGVLGLASQTPFRDGLNELLRSDNYIKGVLVKQTKFGVEINMYIIVAYGIKITEVVSEVQKKVRYVLKKTLDINFRAVNIYVQSTKVI